LDDATQELRRTLKIAAEAHSLELECWARLHLGWIAEVSGDAQEVLEQARRVLQVAQKLGSPPNHTLLPHWLFSGWHLLAGRWEEARESAERSLAIARDARVELASEPGRLNSLAEAFLGSRDWAEARQTAETAIAGARRSRTKGYEVQAHRLLALALLHSQGTRAEPQIEAALAQAEALIAETGARVHTPKLLEARGEVARVLGNEAEWERQLGEAHRAYTEIGATGHAERLARELGL
jgi:tetratricopeptide (TPR) repeat protein